MVHNSTVMGKPSIAILGAGRAGSALARALHAAGYSIAAIWNRTHNHAASLAAEVGAPIVALHQIPVHAQLILIAVPDDNVAEVARELADTDAGLRNRMVVHLSGALAAAVLAPLAKRGAMIGGFHPLVAIAGREQRLPRGIYFGVEAEEPLRGLLLEMARDLGGEALDLEPDRRVLYHAAAVLASNYTVVLAALAVDLLRQAGGESEGALRAILPLLRSTLANLESKGLPGALTGPLARGDAGTIAAHLQALDLQAPATAEAYRALASAALPLLEARGALDQEMLERVEELVRGQQAGLTQ